MGCHFLYWCELNPGDQATWALAILAFCALVANIILLRMTFLQRHDSLRPYVYLGFEERRTSKSLDIMLVVQNTGRTEAKNVRIQSTPPLSDLQSEYDSNSEYRIDPFLNHSVILPSAAFRVFLAEIGYIINYKRSSQREPIFEIRIDYDGPRGKHYDHSYTLDFRSVSFNKLLPIE